MVIQLADFRVSPLWSAHDECAGPFGAEDRSACLVVYGLAHAMLGEAKARPGFDV